MFAGYRQPDRFERTRVGVDAIASHELRRVEWFRSEHRITKVRDSATGSYVDVPEVLPWLGEFEGQEQTVRTTVEGPRWRIEISPGTVRIAATDPVKRERALARARVAAALKERDRQRREQFEPCWDGCFRVNCEGCRRYDVPPAGKIRCFSRSSRRMMTLRLATLDYAPLFVNAMGEQTVPAMVTLTYPGDWLAVAPTNRAVRRHVEQLRKRWDREYAFWGFPLVGVWKREFQERGAPHFHILCVPPAMPGFQQWLSETWADIVSAEWCGERCWEDEHGRTIKGGACCERGRHVAVGTGVDFREGARATDPRRLAIYFSKHGGYAAKDYQNDAPAEWLARGGVGRFWGVWGLRRAVATVGLSPDVALAVARALRGYQRTQRFQKRVRVLRCVRNEVDPNTGELLHEHSRGCFRSTSVTVQRFKGSAGFVLVNDAPSLAADLARVADQVQGRPDRYYTTASGIRSKGTSGLGPVGFLPP
ncbi:rolling circle replication-associated protein [Nocardioides marmoriginsengisoli]|nr:hypothetical protein [Nocardioides marmoriginsengisoli]